jgi:hypothetical protein
LTGDEINYSVDLETNGVAVIKLQD